MGAQVLLYEYLTSGCACDLVHSSAGASLLVEGEAMVRAVARDLAAAGLNTVVLRDERLPPLSIDGLESVAVGEADDDIRLLERWTRRVDQTILIAPEIGGALLVRCRAVEAVGGELASPDSQFVALTSDKFVTNRWLAERGVAVPAAFLQASPCQVPSGIEFPVVSKPRDGAGSQEIRVVQDSRELAETRGPVYCEQLCPGVPASVAVLCGAGSPRALMPCRQVLQDGSFAYVGGEFPLPDYQAERARALAERAIRCLPDTVGYVGVDLVLGSAVDGSEDVVIEVNPRLTTSYIGLRRLARVNLASAMLAAAAGRRVPVEFSRQPLRFSVSTSASLPESAF